MPLLKHQLPVAGLAMTQVFISQNVLPMDRRVEAGFCCLDRVCIEESAW